jgi:phospholipase C
MNTLNRRASPFPNALHAQGRVMNGAFRIDLRNDGRTAAEFQIQSKPDMDALRTYTVEAGNSLCGWWEGVAGTGEYDLTVHGPDGFFRNFRGTLSGADGRVVEVRATYDVHPHGVRLELSNPTGQELIVSIFDRYKSRTTAFVVDPGESESRRWAVERTGGWYDLTVTVNGNRTFATQLAGHVENGEDSISDRLIEAFV